MCFHPTFPKTCSLSCSCTADTNVHTPQYHSIQLYSCNQYLYVSICFNVGQFTKKKRQLRLSIAHPDSVYALKSEVWIPKLLLKKTWERLYVLNLEMTNAHLTVWKRMTLNIKSPRTSWPFSSLIWHWRSHHPQRYSCGTAYGTRYQGRRWNGADGLMVSGCLGVPFKGTNAILSELLIINVWYIDQYLFWYSIERFEFERLFLLTFYI